jgi:hypothetical protein
VRKIVHPRWKKRLGPVQIGAKVGIPASTVHTVLVRCRLNRLPHVDRRTGEVVRRYEHQTPGAMIQVDVKKLGNNLDGGGWRYVGRKHGGRNRAVTPGKPRNVYRGALIGRKRRRKGGGLRRALCPRRRRRSAPRITSGRTP